MTVEELIELLKTEDPKAQVFIHLVCYVSNRRSTMLVSDPLESVASWPLINRVYLMPNQEKIYGR